MTITEEHAKQQWCPFTKNSKCKGSECRMAWRWDDMPARLACKHYTNCDFKDCISKIWDDEPAYSKYNLWGMGDNRICRGCGAKLYWKNVPEKRKGYCGLAGKPRFNE